MKTIILWVCLAIFVGICIGHKFTQSNEKVVEKVVYQDKIVEKTTTVVKRTESKDGTVVTETNIVQDKTEDKKLEKLVDAAPIKSNYFVLVTKSIPYGGIKDSVTRIQVSRRFIGNVFLSVGIDSEKQVSLGVAIEF